MVSEDRSRACGFDSLMFHFHVTTLVKVIRRHVPLSPSSIVWYWAKGGDAVQLGR